MRMKNISLSIAVISATIFLPSMHTPTSAQSLSGRTITLVVNSSPGGATALTAQVAAQAWSEMMEGNPTIVVESVTGGALSRGIHRVMDARPDGLTLGWVAWSGSTRVLDPEELRIDFDRFEPIAGVGGALFYMQVGTKTGGGLEKAEDLVNVDSVTYGGYHAKSASGMRTAASFELLGIDYSYVSGFAGDGQMLAAVQRGEIDGYPATIAAYHNHLKGGPIADGEILPLFYFGPPTEDGSAMQSVPGLEEMEPFDVFYEKVRGERPSGPIWDMIQYHGRVTDPVQWLVVAPPGTPEPLLQMFRESFEKAIETEGFKSNMARLMQIEPTILLADEVSDVIDEVQNTSTEIKALMNDYVEKMSR